MNDEPRLAGYGQCKIVLILTVTLFVCGHNLGLQVSFCTP